MGWLESLFRYSISQEGVNEIYRTIVELEIEHSDNYLKLYQTSQEAGQEELARQARRYITNSIQSLTTVSSGYSANGKVTLKLDDKVNKQIKKLREAVD